jgi:DNA-binding PadR family transcriptional regulator
MSVRHALLGLIAQRPRHGYELRAAFEAMMGGAVNWDVKPGQVYATLARLTESGQVSRHAGDLDRDRERQVYSLTEAGRKNLHDWFNQPVISEHRRNEFFAKLMVAIATGEPFPARTIQVQRTQLYRELHEAVTQRQRAQPATELAHILLLDSVAMHLEADLRWLDLVEARLQEISRQPLPAPALRPRGRPRLKPRAEQEPKEPMEQQKPESKEEEG